MSKPTMYLISDDHDVIEKARKYWEGSSVSLTVFSPSQWKDGLDNVSFRSQLGGGGVPSLVGGGGQGVFSGNQTPSMNGGLPNNVVQFPVRVSSPDGVQKISSMEALAIENAISQYRGNLTEAAKALGIGRATLYRKVKQYNIDPSSARKRRQAA